MAGRSGRGTRVITLRIPPELLSELDGYCHDAGGRRYEGEYTRTEFILAAVREKLAHLERSKRKRPARPAAVRAADSALELLAELIPVQCQESARIPANEGQ